MTNPGDGVTARIDSIYRAESRLIRLLGDFELAEDALQESFRAALAQWPREGVPAPHAFPERAREPSRSAPSSNFPICLRAETNIPA